MRLTWDDNAYNAVEKVALDKYGNTGASILVQFRQKYAFENEDEWEECTELLLNDGNDWNTPKYVWENDWWEGQQDVDLIAVAPVYATKLDDEWKVEVET